MSRLEQLRPWLQALERHTEVPGWSEPMKLDDALATGVVWLRCEEPAPVPELYEALELLALLALDDYDEWLRVLMSIWPHATTFWANAFHPKAFRLGIDVSVRRSGELSRWVERALLLDPWLAIPNAVYASTRGQLEASIRCTGDRNEDLPEVPVRFTILDGEPDQVSLLLFEAVQLASILSARRARVAKLRRWAPLFRLDSLELDVKDVKMTTKDLLYQQEITSCDVNFGTLKTLSANTIEEPTALYSVSCLHSMIVAPEKFANKPVTTIKIGAASSRQMLDGIFGAVLQSKTVESLNVIAIEDDDANRDRLMYWLAACAFGRHRGASFDTLTLKNIEMGDVGVLERTLHDGDGMFQLFHEADAWEQDAYVVENVSTFALVCPRADAPEPPQLSVEVPFEKLRVISVGIEWVSVLLPGWGQAWVRRTDITLRPNSNATRASLSNAGPVSTLHLFYKTEPVILRFLRLVGGSAKRLLINWLQDDQPLSANVVRDVCLACPELEELHTCVGAESLDVVGQCYADGFCRARRLDLDLVHDTIHDTTVFSFFTWLGDEHHQLAQHLAELDLTIHTPQLSYQTRQLLSAATEMLHRNRFFSRLSIRFEISDHDACFAAVATVAMFEAAFARHNGQSVAVEAAPLGVKERVALLSVLRSSHPLYGAVGSSMDAGVVSRIFAYAAYCKKRQVQVIVMP